MFNFIVAKHQNVFEINDDTLTDKRFKNMIHQPHERTWCVRQPEWHDHPLVQPISCFERGFPLVPSTHTDLMVATS